VIAEAQWRYTSSLGICAKSSEDNSNARDLNWLDDSA
jgi:hypothetical protein